MEQKKKNRYSNDFEQYTHASIDDWIKNDPDVRREIIDFGLWIDDEDAELDTEQASWFDCLEDALLAAWDAIDGGADADNVCIMAFTRSNGECWWNFPIEFNSLGTAFTDHDIYHLVADREDEAEIRERKKELA